MTPPRRVSTGNLSPASPSPMYIPPAQPRLWTCYLLSWERCSCVVTSVFSLSLCWLFFFFHTGDSFVVASVCQFGLVFFCWLGLFFGCFFLLLLTKLET